MPAELQHLSLMNAALGDGIRLGEAPVTKTIEFLDVSHEGELALPRLMKDRITADTVLLLDPNRGVSELILNLRRHIKTQPVDILIRAFRIKNHSGLHPVLRPGNAEVMKFFVKSPPHEVVDEVRILRGIGYSLGVPY